MSGLEKLPPKDASAELDSARPYSRGELAADRLVGRFQCGDSYNLNAWGAAIVRAWGHGGVVRG